jgi:hypothetical protein
MSMDDELSKWRRDMERRIAEQRAARAKGGGVYNGS